MNYVFEITTPANTAETAKQRTVLTMPRGRIIKLEVQFPPGPMGLLHVHINRSVHQVWPANANEDYVGDGQIISIPADYLLITDPLQFEAYTWNEDDRYQHLVILRFDVMTFTETLAITPEELERSAAEREQV